MEITESCRRAVELLNIPHSSSSTVPVVTISVGLATVMPSLELNLRTVVNTADKGLYQAKSAGRNCIQWISVEQAVSEEALVDTT